MSDKFRELISIRIKNARVSLGCTQTKIADKAGISSAALSKIESGKCIPTILVIRKIADALKLNVVDLIIDKPITLTETSYVEHEFYRNFKDILKLSKSNQGIICDLVDRLNPDGGEIK